MKRMLDSWWFQLILGVLALIVISAIMFDAVAIGVLGRSVFFDYPK